MMPPKTPSKNYRKDPAQKMKGHGLLLNQKQTHFFNSTKMSCS
jgi:hypothetical protein